MKTTKERLKELGIILGFLAFGVAVAVATFMFESAIENMFG